MKNKLTVWLRRLTTRAPVTDAQRRLKAAFNQGYEGYLLGEANPHPPGSDLAKAWQKGADASCVTHW